MSEAKRIAERLKTAKRAIVAAHYHPEGDATGSTLALVLALRSLGIDAHPFNRDGVPFNLRFLEGAGDTLTTPPSWDPDVVAVVDCGDFHRVGEEAQKKFEKAPLVINVDHHGTNTKFGAINWVDARAAATGEMIAELIDELGVKWTPGMAEAVYTALVADTGSFQFANTTSVTHKIASRMIELGADSEKVARHIFFDNPEKNLRLLAMVLATLRVELGGRAASVEITTDMFDKTGTDAEATEGMVDYPRSVSGVEVAVLFRQTKDAEYKISLRSKGDLDMTRVAKAYGGGGHKAAAGCTVKGTLEEVRKDVLGKIGELLAESARA